MEKLHLTAQALNQDRDQFCSRHGQSVNNQILHVMNKVYSKHFVLYKFCNLKHKQFNE